ncbi:MAG: OmpA family protein [Candidatus Marinimicrobia bacterium]|nr:OmpA family protein [Candidatus Neomarinimicrobiota bacterium]MCF7922159.1 OmpA family protein [Candidatus Neomarinimicrobiota bacterium]
MRYLRIMLLVLMGLSLFTCSAQKELQKANQQQLMEIEKLHLENADLKAQLQNRSQVMTDLMAKLEAVENVQVKNNRVMIANAILFTSGSTKITEAGKKTLDQVWDILVTVPDREILIEGHTDNDPISEKFLDKYKTNWELSSVRALAVLHYVSKHPNVHLSRLGAVGYGEYRPVAGNDTEAGKQTNRRVEIVIGKQL